MVIHSRDKLDKLEAILERTLFERVVPFQTLEKLAGKCVNICVACPAAALYTRRIYKHIGNFQGQGGRRRNTGVVLAANDGLRLKTRKWLEA